MMTPLAFIYFRRNEGQRCSVKHKRFHLPQILSERDIRDIRDIEECVGHRLSHALPDLTGK